MDKRTGYVVFAGIVSILVVLSYAIVRFDSLEKAMTEREVSVPTYSFEGMVGTVKVKHSCPRERGETPQEHAARGVAEFTVLVDAEKSKQ